MLLNTIFQPLPLLIAESIQQLLVEIESIVYQHNMGLEVVLAVDDVVLMYAGVSVGPSDGIFWFVNEIQENVPCEMLL